LKSENLSAIIDEIINYQYSLCKGVII